MKPQYRRPARFLRMTGDTSTRSGMHSERVSRYGQNGATSVKENEPGRFSAVNLAKPWEITSDRVIPKTPRPLRRLRIWLFIAILLMLVIILTPFTIVELIKATNNSKIYSTVQAIPA